VTIHKGPVLAHDKDLKTLDDKVELNLGVLRRYSGNLKHFIAEIDRKTNRESVCKALNKHALENPYLP
jgi:hypothetical protein